MHPSIHTSRQTRANSDVFVQPLFLLEMLWEVWNRRRHGTVGMAMTWCWGVLFSEKPLCKSDFEAKLVKILGCVVQFGVVCQDFCFWKTSVPNAAAFCFERSPYILSAFDPRVGAVRARWGQSFYAIWQALRVFWPEYLQHSTTVPRYLMGQTVKPATVHLVVQMAWSAPLIKHGGNIVSLTYPYTYHDISMWHIRQNRLFSRQKSIP